MNLISTSYAVSSMLSCPHIVCLSDRWESRLSLVVVCFFSEYGVV